jgi:hypothetical protein
MLEKETYGKMKKMCSTLDDIRRLLIVLVEKSWHDGCTEVHEDDEEEFSEWMRSTIDGVVNKKE